ncbi:MAG: hypothetical protein ACI8ZX_001357 [Planctomycetota bacterium]|jgi:hypothetical protein
MRNLGTTTENFQIKNANVFNNKINTEQLFEYAIEQANKGYNLKALEIAREALISAKSENMYIAIYIHSFMAALSLDFLQYGNARIHIYNAMNRLNKNHFNYNIDKGYLNALLRKVEKTDKEYKQLEFDALAA